MRDQLRIYDERDLPWIADLLDVVEASLGEPWHIMVERVEYVLLAVHPAHRTAMLHALRRVLGGDSQRARLARRARTLMLGPPVRNAAERRERLAMVAATLGTTPEDVESLLWPELSHDRPVMLPEGRPAETELAAFANLERIQRCVRRAHAIELRLWGQVDHLVRSIARHALIEQIRRDGDATVIEVTGPLALCHSTFVYGRALSQFVPLLGGPWRFALDVSCRLGGEPARLQIASPVWLPPPSDAPSPTPSAVERLAEDLEALGLRVERAPPAIASDAQLLFPDLALDRGSARWFIEVLGFVTRDSLVAKLASYRAAGIDSVVLCANTTTAPGCDLAPRTCGFTREVDIDDLLATMAAAR